MAIDYDALFGGDDYSPCDALKALRPAYMKMVAGEGAQVVVFRDRRVEFAKPDLDAFKSLITQLEGECAAVKGIAPRRRAIIAGFRG